MKHRARPWRGLASAAFAMCALAFAAADWALQRAGSEISFEAMQEGATFKGRFKEFDARIRFDPARLDAGSIEVEVALESVDTADAERDELLRGEDFFAVHRWPRARFIANHFVAHRDGSFSAEGQLTLRDVTRTVPISFRFEQRGNRATLVGSATLRRLDFGIGQGEWRDAASLGDEVRVRYMLRLAPQ